jgi:cell division protein FtsN
VTQNKDFRKGAPRRPASRRGVAPWIWALLGAAVAVPVLLLALHLHNRPKAEGDATKAKKPDAPVLPKLAQPDPNAKPKYDYDTLLKHNKVEIPEKPPAPPLQDPKPAAESHPGTLMLQVASYRTAQDAEAQRARLAILGLEAKVQMVTVNEQTWYRVRLGPFKTTDEMNHARARLHASGLEGAPARATD